MPAIYSSLDIKTCLRRALGTVHLPPSAHYSWPVCAQTNKCVTSGHGLASLCSTSMAMVAILTHTIAPLYLLRLRRA